MNTPEHFWNRVDQSNGPESCWNFSGSINAKTGYGQSAFKGKKWDSHRVAWTLANGIIENGLYVLHRCDNKKCCNPKHLFLGTHTDNMRDMRSKGRSVRGERNNVAKMTDAKVKEIRALFSQGIPLQEIAALYEITASNVGYIASRKTWKHVP